MEDSASALLESALAHHEAGRRDEAERLYREVLAREPRNAVASHNLAVLAMQSGRGIAAALPSFRAAWEADPSHARHWISYLRALVEAGDIETARAVHADGTRRKLQGPSVDALLGRGVAAPAPHGVATTAPAPAQIEAMVRLAREGRFAEVERIARAWTREHAGSAIAWKALGWALVELDRAGDAMPALEEAARRDPRDAETLELLGRALLRMSMVKEAEDALRRATRADAGNAAAFHGLARALLAQRRLDDARGACERALALQADFAEAHATLADIDALLGRRAQALEGYRRALEIRPTLGAAYHALFALLLEDRRLEDAEAVTRRYIAALPGDAQARVNLGAILANLGRLDEAVRAYGEALELQPDSLAIRSARLLTRNLTGETGAAMREEAALYGRFATRQARPFTTWKCARDPGRLVVGFVSGDLGEHPVGYFLESVLASAERDRVEWIGYPTFHRNDEVARRIESHVSRWHSLAGLDDGAAAERIREDGVHVLLDLAGHTAGNRLPVFAWRPAPVQASWLGYFATTGVEQMDFLVADAISVPPSDEAHFTERIERLRDTRLCFTPPRDAPEIAVLPATARGHVTFGSFQKLTKINDEVLRAWARVLEASPGARLRLQGRGLGDATLAQRMRERMGAAGIDASRVALCEGTSRAAYLAAHAQVDIILDTFPYPGGTTTCEALWMGVPTVTLAGATLLSRQGASMLTAAGLDDWIAGSLEGYVTLAARKAGDPASLAALRAAMRQRISRTPLLDAPRFARSLDDALWEMWSARTLSA